MSARFLLLVALAAFATAALAVGCSPVVRDPSEPRFAAAACVVTATPPASLTPAPAADVAQARAGTRYPYNLPEYTGDVSAVIAIRASDGPSSAAVAR